MENIKKSRIAIFGFVVVCFLLLIIHPTAQASSNKYFDFGPYYTNSQVLGISFSALENLPAITIPKEIVPGKATGILPDNPFHGFETFFENVQLGLTFDPVKKEEFLVSLAQERVAEAKTMLEEGKTEAAKEAMNEYESHVLTLTQNISNLTSTQKDNPATQALINKIEDTAASHAILSQSLSIESSPVKADVWSQTSQSSRKLLDTIADLKGEPVMPEELKTDIQKLKEQGIVSEEQSNKLFSYKTRGELRDELEKLSTSGQFPLSELAALDTEIAKRYKDSYDQQVANLEVIELKAYQTLPQPSEDILKEMQTWQEDSSAPPPNTIRPYLWYSRAQDLAKEVDLSHFSSAQQTDVSKFYPQAISDNPTYSPPPAPSVTPSVTPTPTQSEVAPGQPTPSVSQTPTSIPSPTPQPTPQSVSAVPYLGEKGDVLPLPGDPTYFFKQFGEQVRFTFTFDPAQKARLKMQEAERRLSEAKQLSDDTKKADLYEAALTRYRDTIDDASSYLKNISDPTKAKDAAQQMESIAARHEIVLEKGLLPAPVNKPTLITDVIKSTENAMDISADKLEKPALPVALSIRLDDLKAQGLILPEEADDLVRSKSREEARSKIRKLVELETFPPADAKKLDEAQTLASNSDYNQLVEVRKVEELQNLRATQAEFAQTPTLKATAETLSQREIALTNTIDPSVIKPEDFAGREDLLKIYQTISKEVRPINSGQFGPDVKPGVTPSVTPSVTPRATIVDDPRPANVTPTACPIGATFKESEGCVWADTGKKINDYWQYTCDGPREYYSFALKKCMTREPGKEFGEDSGPICPVGYAWSWEAQGCQTATLIIPTPSPSVTPGPIDVIDEKERQELEKQCPERSSYLPPNGCVWNKDGKEVFDPKQYKCTPGQYYSFEELSCVANPKTGEAYPKDAGPTCKEENTVWSWSQGGCKTLLQPSTLAQTGNYEIPKPFLVAPDSPFYFVKQLGETIQLATAFGPKAKEEVRIAQAKERLAEGYDALTKKDEAQFKESLSDYTAKMQELYNDLSKSTLSPQDKKTVGEHLAQEAVAQNLLLQNISAVANDAQETSVTAAVSSTVLLVDKAADVLGEPPIPPDIKEKIENLPEGMIPEEEKKKLLETSSRVDARLKLGGLLTNGILTQTDTAFLNEDFEKANTQGKFKIEELKKLEEITAVTKQKDETEKKVEENEKIVKGLGEFEKTFEVGNDVPADIRPYVRLTRINEVAQTIRPDIVRLEDFANRRDIQLAVATLKEEFKPTKESFQQVEDFRRRNPNIPLPYNLARIEALSYGLGVRGQAESCFLPTPPFPANTPCPAPGAAIPITSFFGPRPVDEEGYRPGYNIPSIDKDGKPLVYGQGPKAESAGSCPDGYHWMYDSGGWCMSNSGSYSSSYNYTPSGTGPGYTPYSPYYNAPGVPPATYGYNDPNFINLYNPLPGGPTYNYSPPSYYGIAPTNYTTNPPAGTVPGSGPKPTAPGQCPSGYHWMSDSGGWCMADANTYVPSNYSGLAPGSSTSGTAPSGGYNCGSQPFDPSTGKCKDGACPGGYNWDGSKCVVPSPNLNASSCGPGYYWSNNACFPNPTYSGGGSSPSSYQYGCTPGYYWDGGKCVPGSNSSGGWSDTAARTGSYCQPPSGGCGSNNYWDYGSCNCRSSGSYSGGATSGGTSGGTSYSCSPPSGGCGSGYFDSGSCSCKQASSQGCYNVSASSCGSGFYWDSGACTCRSNTPSSTSSSTGTTSPSSGSTTSSGSCPSGYHWMSDSGGWCMSDGGGSTSSYSSPPPSTTTTTSPPPSESSPPPSTTTTTSPPPSTTTTTSPPPSESSPPPPTSP